MSAAPVTLRAVSPADSALLAALHAETFTAPWDQPWTAQSFADILALPTAEGLIAATSDALDSQFRDTQPRDPQPRDPQPVGFGLTLKSGEEVELLLLAIRPAWRKQGLGGHLLAQLMAKAGAAGARRGLLEVSAANPAALACYARAGFRPCGRRRDYYQPGNDAVVMEIDIAVTK